MSYQAQGYGQYGHPAGQQQGQGQYGQPGTPQQYGYGAPTNQQVEDITQQVGRMGMDDANATPQQPRRKKDRHAYHQIEQSVSTDQAFNGAPAGQFANGHAASSQPASQPGAAPWQQTSQPWQSQTLPSATAQPVAPAGTPIRMDAPQQANVAPGGQQQGQNRVNAEQIPSIPVSRDVPADYYRANIYPTMQQRLPPPAVTPFAAVDEGNASPKHARLTMSCIPTSHEQLMTTSIPLGLVLQPLARLTEEDTQIPLLDFGDTGPPRCRRCRAYINPAMIFSNGGNRMTCNLCGHPNEVSPDYFAPTDPSGVRVDVQQRPELMLGTCEFLVPREYWSKEPVGQNTLFLIDVSAESCARGFLKAVCDGIIAALYGDDLDVAPPSGGDETEEKESTPNTTKAPAGSKVGFVTFDREIHLYDVSSAQSKPQQLVMPDLQEPFAAVSPHTLYVDAAECKSNILSLLRQIPDMFANIRHAEPALLPSLQTALATLSETGGKVICTLAALPTYGPGNLTLRDKGALTGANDIPEYEKTLFRTDNQHFKKLQADMIRAGVGVDFFLTAPTGGYLDIATVGLVSEKTGGETFYFPNWSWPRDVLKLEKELSHVVQRQQGYAALMKVRCSNGLQIANYCGNFTQHTFGADLEMGTVTEDTAVCVVFSYDGKLDPRLNAHFQSAILYTSASGQRIVRCTNVVATVTETARDSMRFIDQDAVLTVLAKDSASRVPDTRSLHETRSYLQDKTTEILASYRKHHSGSHPPGQLVMPENLKEFAMYVLGLIKSRALKGGREPSDRRVHELRLLRGLGPAELSLYLYPRIIALHNLDPAEGFADPTSGQLRMPRALRASFAALEDGGAYLVDNGQQLLLWLHAQVSPNLLEDLFGPGCDDLTKLDPQMSALPVLDTLLNAQVRNVLLAMEREPGRGSKGLAIQLARQGLDGAEFEFARLLYEDRNGEGSSYVDWLVLLHRGVGTELSGQRSKAGGENIGQSVTSTFTSIANNVPYWSQK